MARAVSACCTVLVGLQEGFALQCVVLFVRVLSSLPWGSCRLEWARRLLLVVDGWMLLCIQFGVPLELALIFINRAAPQVAVQPLVVVQFAAEVAVLALFRISTLSAACISILCAACISTPGNTLCLLCCVRGPAAPRQCLIGALSNTLQSP